MLLPSALVWTALLLLHPGHSTRVELEAGPDGRTLELAMRIDHADLEAALRKRYPEAIAIERISDDEAAKRIGEYLRQTIRIDQAEIPRHRFRWVGWERKRLTTWAYVELVLADESAPPPTSVLLTIRTLLEIEPDLNHVVSLRSGPKTTSFVLGKDKPSLKVPLDAGQTLTNPAPAP